MDTSKPLRSRLEKEQRELLKKRATVSRQIDSVLQDELLVSESARLRAVAGKDALGRVNTFQKLHDRWCAISDALRNRHELYDVIRAYEAFLEDAAEAEKLRYKSARLLRFMSEKGIDQDFSKKLQDEEFLREDGSKITDADKIKSRMLALQAAIKLLNDFIKSIQHTGETQYEKYLLQEEGKFLPLYEKWQAYLQRPAYSENISAAIKSMAESSFRTTDNKVEQSIEDTASIMQKAVSAIRSVSDAISGLSLGFAVPIEASFTYPAFAVLNPDNALFALSGCFIFTCSLVGCGYATTACFRKGIRNTVEEVQPSRYKIISHKSTSWLAFSGLMFCAGLVLIISGADLRAKIPAMTEWTQAYDSLTTDQDEYNRYQSINPTDTASIKEKSDEIEKKRRTLSDERKTIFLFGSQEVHSDELIALGIYAFLFFLGGIKNLTSTDPFFEYHLLAAYLTSISECKLRLANFRDALMTSNNQQIAEHNKKLTDLRADLWLLDPTDNLALSRNDHQLDSDGGGASVSNLGYSQSPGSKESKSAEEEDLTKTDFDKIWIKQRLRTYVRMFTCLRGKSLKQHCANSLTRAMA